MRRSAASITSSLHTSTGAQAGQCSNMSPKLVSERVKKKIRASTTKYGRGWGISWKGPDDTKGSTQFRILSFRVLSAARMLLC